MVGLCLIDPVDNNTWGPQGPGYPSAVSRLGAARPIPAAVIGAGMSADCVPSSANFRFASCLCYPSPASHQFRVPLCRKPQRIWKFMVLARPVRMSAGHQLSVRARPCDQEVTYGGSLPRLRSAVPAQAKLWAHADVIWQQGTLLVDRSEVCSVICDTRFLWEDGESIMIMRA